MSGLPARLTVVTLGARDVERQRAFYRALGFPSLAEADDGFTAFRAGAIVLALYPLELLSAEAAPGATVPAPGWTGITLAINVDARDDVDTGYAAALAAGAQQVAAPTDREWGGRSAYFADPEGNRWEIAWADMLELDERGAVVRFGS